MGILGFTVAVPGRWAAPRAAQIGHSRPGISQGAVRAARRRRAHAPTPRMSDSGDAAAPEELMRSPDFLERVRGITRASEIATTSGKVAALIPLATEDGNSQVRYAAVSRLASLELPGLSDSEREQLLVAARFVLVNDKESSCQSGAADLIAGLKLLDGFDDLVAAFNTTSDWMLQFSIASGLGEMGDPRAYDFLVSILDNAEGANFLLVAGAIGSLGELGDPRGLDVVKRFADHEDQSIRDRAGIAIEMLSGKEPAH